jgi:hypothetical protein
MPLTKWFVSGLLGPNSPQLELPSFFFPVAEKRKEAGGEEVGFVSVRGQGLIRLLRCDKD